MVNNTRQSKTITAHSAADFRRWLFKNHQREKRVAVILYKRHTGKPAPTHRELMEEAICFGWIDTTIKRLDEDRFLRNFSRRNENSKWSDNTLSYAKQLLRKGKMSAEGNRFYKQGLKKPTHDHGIPKNPALPAELKKELAKHKRAEAFFDTLPPSTKKMLYRWYLSAKLPATRARRLAHIVALARKNERSVF